MNTARVGGTPGECRQRYLPFGHFGRSPPSPLKAYDFAGCDDGSRAGITRGADYFRLHVEQGDETDGSTQVQVALGTTSGGEVAGTRTFLSSDPRTLGASLTVPQGAAPGTQNFSLNFQGNADSSFLPRSLGVGPEVALSADNAAGEFKFDETTPCTQIAIPYDPSLLAQAPAAAQKTLAVYQVVQTSLTEQALSLPAGSQTVNSADSTISFCAQHLSTYEAFVNNPTADSLVCNDCVGAESYNNGPVLSSPILWSIFIGNPVLNAALSQTTENKFLQELCASDYFSVIAQYSEGAPIGTCSFGGTYLDTTTSFEHMIGSAIAANGNAVVTDTEVQHWLTSELLTLSGQPVPESSSSQPIIYVVYFPEGITIQNGAEATCGGGVTTYHSSTSLSGQPIYYAVLPACNDNTPYLSFGATHEIIETTTDPIDGSGWNDANCSETTTEGGELTDKVCVRKWISDRDLPSPETMVERGERLREHARRTDQCSNLTRR